MDCTQKGESAIAGSSSASDAPTITTTNLSSNLSESSNEQATTNGHSQQATPASVGQKKLFVANLHQSTSEGDLIKLFQYCGKVVFIDYVWHRGGPLKGTPKGFAFIEMDTIAEAQRAITRLNGQVVRGKKLFVAPKNDNDIQQIQFAIIKPQSPQEPKSSPLQSDNNKTTPVIVSRQCANQLSNNLQYRRQGLQNPSILGAKRTAIIASCMDDNIKKLKATLNNM